MKRKESCTAIHRRGCITRAETVTITNTGMITTQSDRVAASKIYNGKNYTDGAPFTYFCRIRGKHRMHPNTEALLEKLLVMLRDEGEEKTFAYIRSMKK